MRKYTIVVPVHGAVDDAKLCIESVLRCTGGEHAVIIWLDNDDNCDDYVFERIEEHADGRVVVCSNPDNLGFVKTVNLAIDFTEGDLVVLNSDTIVTPGWLDELDNARYTADRDYRFKVAAVCPVSNNATLATVGPCDLPVAVDDVARIVAEEGVAGAFEEAPVINGFCMMLTREALNAVGNFDEAFSPGYGEEVDWCLRARAAGFVCLIAPGAYVYHKGHASFGRSPEIVEHRRKVEALIRDRWPRYEDELREWYKRAPLLELDLLVHDRLRPRVPGDLLRVMHVLHVYGTVGGVQENTRRMVSETKNDVESIITYPKDLGSTASHHCVFDGSALRVEVNNRHMSAKIAANGWPMSNRDEWSEAIFDRIVTTLAPSVVHFEHVIGWGTTRLGDIAGRHAKTILAIRDHYFACPMLLIDPPDDCPGRVANCDACVSCIAKKCDARVACNKRDEAKALLEDRVEIRFDRVISPSQYIADEIGVKVDRVIRHGVSPYPFVRTRTKTDKIRIAFVGAARADKGFGEFAATARDRRDDPRVEFSVLGPTNSTTDRVGLEHVKFLGPYRPEQLPQLLQGFYVVVPAVSPREAYGQVVDECVYAGVPEIWVRGDAPGVQERFEQPLRYDAEVALDYLDLYRELVKELAGAHE